jgi:hypothetical protein
MKELKKASTLTTPLPIWRGCKQRIAETVNSLRVLVSVHFSARLLEN